MVFSEETRDNGQRHECVAWDKVKGMYARGYHSCVLQINVLTEAVF